MSPNSMTNTHDTVLHATAVAIANRGLLILGGSGSGKSTLALEIMAHGGQLVSDDRVLIRREDRVLIADAPPTIRGRIEMRGMGILKAEPYGQVALALAIDLERRELARLPQPRTITLLGLPLRLLFRPDAAHLAAGLVQWLKAGEARDEQD